MKHALSPLPSPLQAPYKPFYCLLIAKSTFATRVYAVSSGSSSGDGGGGDGAGSIMSKFQS